MAADILLYDTDAVPVGDDQKQHLELTRDICHRFNTQNGDTFKMPEPIIPKAGARIMSLDDPAKKMSKSSPSPASFIALDDKPEAILKKFKSAVTDSGREVVYDPENKAAVANLMTIFSLVKGVPVAEIQARYAGKGYGDFKGDLGLAVVEFAAPIQARLAELRANPEQVEAVLKDGAERAGALARTKLSKVRRKLGLGRPSSR